MPHPSYSQSRATRRVGTLTATGITRSHGTTVVLGGIDLTVGPGDRIGLVGANGVGKSTLLRILAGLDRPDSGRLRVAPPNLTVGYMPQETGADAPTGESVRASLARRTGVTTASAALEDAAEALAQSDPPTDGDAAATAYADSLQRVAVTRTVDLSLR